jgi:putative nucleotidyltransferase with HDIG domain
MNNLSLELMGEIGTARDLNKTVESKNGVSIPLTVENGNNIGVMYIESSSYKEGMKLLEIYAKQAALSINNAYMHSLVNIKNDELNTTYAELKKRYVDAIETLRLAVDAKDFYTRGHSDRVSYYAVKMGEYMNMPDSDIELLKIGGIFHDIGKIGTNDDILLKNSKLDDDEYMEIKKHPIKGANILSAMSMFKEAVPLVKYHHERYDGRGYPFGLKGEEIPLLARIISVADAFDAMVSDRVYRTKLDINKAIEQLNLGRNTQFDSKVVECFLKILKDYDKIKEEIKNTYAQIDEQYV